MSLASSKTGHHPAFDRTFCVPTWHVNVSASAVNTAVLTFDVQMTSRRCTFIQLSHAAMCPLYVSPFFSSKSCINQKCTRTSAKCCDVT